MKREWVKRETKHFTFYPFTFHVTRKHMKIVLIALDTQRADHLGCYGYEQNTTPFIDSIARRGVVFERCYAPNIPTHPSFTTMLSGKEAITHNISNIGGGVPIEDGVRLLPEILRDH